MIATFGLLLLYLCALIGLGWRASDQLIHPPEAAHKWNLHDYPRLTSESITFRSKTGTLIAGSFFPGKRRATVILSHGYGGNQGAMLPWANFLHRAGFSVVTYDMRGSGRSGGAVTFGVLEQRDLRSVVDYLSSRRDVDKTRIGALGLSLGGVTTILAAARDHRIRAVVDDSCFSDIRDWLKPSIPDALIHPTKRFSSVSIAIAGARLGIDILSVRPVAAISRISPRPILIIQGTQDTVVPLADSMQNFAAARQPKELWWVRGAGHGQALEKAGVTYSKRVTTFFDRSLGMRS
ncbi:MAG: alpha/beta hydrolase [Chloroflexota bacterium]